MLDELGRADYDRLKARAARRRWTPEADPVVYCIFDLLARDGRSLIGLPIEQRRPARAFVRTLAREVSLPRERPRPACGRPVGHSRLSST